MITKKNSDLKSAFTLDLVDRADRGETEYSLFRCIVRSRYLYFVYINDGEEEVIESFCFLKDDEEAVMFFRMLTEGEVCCDHLFDLKCDCEKDHIH